jgi:trehalose-6-phosphatase
MSLYMHTLRYEHCFSGVGEGADRTGASLLVPIGALRALNRLTALSKGRVLVVSGDKGNNNPEFFRGLIDPHIAVHGSFSVMVNYHAIGM